MAELKLPDFPDARELTLEDKPFFDDLFRELQPRISELTFAGLYLFRTAHEYRVSRLADSVIVSGKGYDGSPYALPPLGGNSLDASRQLLASGRDIYGVCGEHIDTITQNPGVTLREDRDNFDYLYRRSDLAVLPGNRYHKKRNRVSYFERRHEYRAEHFGSTHRDGCLALLNHWQHIHVSMGNGSLQPEIGATVAALTTSGVLGLEGIVVLVGGEVRAFALGERLNATTAVCHFEKADPFFEGLYQLVNREFCRRLFTDCEFLNREQDLGEPTLRQAKLSYHPVELVRKYRISTGNHHKTTQIA